MSFIPKRIIFDLRLSQSEKAELSQKIISHDQDYDIIQQIQSLEKNQKISYTPIAASLPTKINKKVSNSQSNSRMIRNFEQYSLKLKRRLRQNNFVKKVKQNKYITKTQITSKNVFSEEQLRILNIQQDFRRKKKDRQIKFQESNSFSYDFLKRFQRFGINPKQIQAQIKNSFGVKSAMRREKKGFIDRFKNQTQNFTYQTHNYQRLFQNLQEQKKPFRLQVNYRKTNSQNIIIPKDNRSTQNKSLMVSKIGLQAHANACL